MKKRIGIFGWGVVAPKSPDVETFEYNLKRATTWLEPFDGFGPSNFLVGRPEFDFEAYRPWIEARFEPLGLEILSVALSSDADHIITPSREGPRTAMRRALEVAGVAPEDVATWDMHATATPGDWSELQNILSVVPDTTALTARKGSFGHGMSVCGGWELTAQHIGFSKGELHPVDTSEEEFHQQVRPYFSRLVADEKRKIEGEVAGKINMGLGGINACTICRRW